MGKSIRSKRMKKLRTLKREKLAPRETILLEQRAAILSTVKGENVDEAALPVLPEDANAIKRFVHTRDGKAPKVHTLKSRYGHLANNNTCITKFNTLEALSEKYDKVPLVKREGDSFVKKKKATPAEKLAALPSTMTRRRTGRGRDRTAKPVTGSDLTVKDEESKEEVDMTDATNAEEDAEMVDENDIDRDQVKYGEFGKPAHERKSKVKSLLSRKRSKSKGKNGFLNWHNMAASS